MKKRSATRARRKHATRPAAKAVKRSPESALRDRLREAEDTLEAIRTGQVDALVVQGPEGEQIYTLQGADRRYRQLVETMNEGALLLAADGTIVYANARFGRLVGVAMERLLGTPLQTYVVDPSREVVDALLHRRGGDSLKAEAALVTGDGTQIPVYLSATAGWDDDLEITCVIATDLSDQKRNQEMLAAEGLTAKIVEQAAEGIVVCNHRGIIVRASRVAHQLHGANPLLQPFDQAFPLRTAEDPGAARSIIERVLGGETITGDEVSWHRGPDSVDLLLSAAPIWSGDGILGCVFSFVDITERKRAAEERLHLLDQANAARIEAENANRAKDDFLAMLGHELRNPLAPILTALELMNMRGEESSRREREVIARHVKHVVTLVGDLLDVSRIAQGKVELDRRPVDLLSVVNNAVEAVAPLIEERHHQIRIDVPRGLWIDGDATRLCQVLSNLVTNAAKYTPRDGTIDVIAEPFGDDVRILVRDTGAGIPAELLPHLFDLFVQGQRTIERSEGGLGLGLSIVKSLVTLHGGSVSARSDGPGCGSEFEVRLRASRIAPDDELRSIAPAAAPDDRRAGLRIMVVDDNVDAAETLVDALASVGLDARSAFDGPSALELAASFGPDIAVLDIGLPEMDGYELARCLRKLANPPRLIAVTGYGQDSDRQLALDAGFDSHLVKPINLTALTSTIRDVAATARAARDRDQQR